MKRIFIILGLALSLTGSLSAQEKEISSETQTRQFGPKSYEVPARGAWQLLPDISVIGNLTGAFFSDDPVGATGHDPARTGLTLQEIEVVLQSVVDAYFRADVFLSFHETGVELEEGYFTTLGLPKGFQIRGGKILLPLGRHNPKHLHTWDFGDNMLVTKYFLSPEGLSELGIELSYLFPTPFFLQIQGTFSNGDNATSFGGSRKQDFIYQGRLSASFDPTPNTTLLLGASGATGFNGTGLGNQTNLIGGDLLIKWKPKDHRGLTWQSEYFYRQMETPGANQKDGGFYSYVDWQFAKRWHAGLRYDQMGLPEALIANEWRVTPALTFNPTEFSRIRLQYEYDKTVNVRGVHAAFVQFQYSMGPHGAHPF